MNNVNFIKKIQGIYLEKSYCVSKYDEALFKLYQDYAYLKKCNIDFDIKKVQQNFLNTVLSIPADKRLEFLDSTDSSYIWGMMPRRVTSEKILNSIYEDKEIFFAEDAFLRCIIGAAHKLDEDKKHYQYAVGYILDDLTAYFDATRPSRMEQILNSDFEVTDEQIERVKLVIKKIIDNKVSKYNNQPIYSPNIGENSIKVLVIDQSYKDYSILKGCADDSTFKRMLDCAISENPNADIIIKTHPDAVGEDSSKPKCYYSGVKEKNNIYKMTDLINPISMIEYVDKVYVCSSQFGFEALMCGKEVHTFGMPFYAGWGLTVDNQICERRTRQRTLEEIFYIAYIYFSRYINPEKSIEIEVEEAIDYLIKKRKQYFSENNVRCEGLVL